MNILGISAFYHESTCCLLQDGKLVAAAPEERFTRVKHDRRAPINAIRYCLEAGGGLSPADIDCLAYYENPKKKLSRQLSMGLDASVDPTFAWLDPAQPERALRDVVGYDGPIVAFDHHRSHGASSFFFSGFQDAAVLTVDGVGEWATTTYGHGRGNDLTLLEEVLFPDSLGLLYSTVTDFLGFAVLSDEYKVMGLAPYGVPRFVEKIGALVTAGPRGQFSLNRAYFGFSQKERMFTDALVDLIGIPRRIPESEIGQVHRDIARSLQVVLEDTLLEKVRFLHGIAASENLCMAGGVALNCVANRRIHLDGPFKNLFVQPAAGDSGGALGAAALAHIQLTGERHSSERLPHVYLGPEYSAETVGALVRETAIPALDFRGDEGALIEAVVDRLARQQVVAWFHGRMEFGPRSLGARSILADPRDPTMRDRLNALVKKREGFRPFAPAILEAHVSEHMDIDYPSRFMNETCRVRSSLDLPAVTHVDGSARVQTVDSETSPRFARLLTSFYARTGCPILVNTSFNVRGEPIVCTPEDAVRCMANSQIDCLVLEDFVLEKDDIPAFLRRRVAAGDRSLRDRVDVDVHPRLQGSVERWRPAEGVLPHGVYTFV
jgi:carbamoyltransferase